MRCKSQRRSRVSRRTRCSVGLVDVHVDASCRRGGRLHRSSRARRPTRARWASTPARSASVTRHSAHRRRGERRSRRRRAIDSSFPIERARVRVRTSIRPSRIETPRASSRRPRSTRARAAEEPPPLDAANVSISAERAERRARDGSRRARERRGERLTRCARSCASRRACGAM